MARTDDTPNMKGLKDIIRYVKPHILIGLTGGGPAFDQVSNALDCCSCFGVLHVQGPNLDRLAPAASTLARCSSLMLRRYA